jgi:predicted transglutaminase-like protease
VEKKISLKSKTKLFGIQLWMATSLVFLQIFFNSGCGQHRLPVTSQSVRGIWVLDNSSKFWTTTNIDENLLKNVELKLFEDNSFELKNIPSCWELSSTECSNELNSYAGSWRLSEDTNVNYELVLNISNRNQIHAVEVYQNNTDLKLYFVVGDPDSNKTIILMKKK